MDSSFVQLTVWNSTEQPLQQIPCSYLFSCSPALLTVQSSSRINNMYTYANSDKNHSGKVDPVSIKSASYAEYNFNIFVAISKILMKFDAFVMCHQYI